MSHWPAMQALLPLATAAQALPQLPQFWVEVMSTSQPLAKLLSQSLKWRLQALTVQAPATQAATPLAGAAQAFPQPPQLVMLVAVSVSQPVLILRSQSAS